MFQNSKYKSGRVITLSDYDIIEFKNKRILTIGGGTSIDIGNKMAGVIGKMKKLPI